MTTKYGFGVGLVWLATLMSAPTAHAYQFDALEQAYRFAYLSTPISIEGRVVDQDGASLPGAQIRLIGWGEGLINDGEATTSWTGGSFELPDLARRNVLLVVELPGYYTEIVPIELQQPIDEDIVELPEIQLVAQEFGRVRLSFAGDVMFGRRMFERGILHHATLAADTRALFRYVEPILAVDDHTTINLETPITAHLQTPHPSKSYVFNSYPESAVALPEVGVDSVSLGNNHVYDYLGPGLLDTLATLDEVGMSHYGAGIDASHAAAQVERRTIHGVELALQGFSAIRGSSPELIASDHPSKAGALYGSAAALDAFVEHEVAAGRAAIPMIHGGIEYAAAQSPQLRSMFERAVADGAALVVAHHPHVVHGVTLVDAGDGPRYVFGSLGNFIFDQEIFETLRSYVVVVDLVEAEAGPRVERVRLIPVERNDYAPRLLVGEALARFGRTVAQRSTDEAQALGLAPAYVFAEGGRLVVSRDRADLTTTDAFDRRELAVHAGSTAIVELEPYTMTDALAQLRSASAAICEVGHDRLEIGDFEDHDVDSNADEADLWTLASGVYVQGLEVHRGVGAMVLLRHASQALSTSLTPTYRIAVRPGARMSVHGWDQGRNAGAVRVRVRWLRSDGSTLSSKIAYARTGGDWDWAAWSGDLTVPDLAAAMMLEIEQAPPAAGEGRLVVDDLSVIEWDPSAIAVGPETRADLATPNAWGFVRCAAAGASLELTLVHRCYASGRRRYRSRLPEPTRVRATTSSGDGVREPARSLSRG